MPSWADWIKPEYIIPVVGGLVGLGIFFLLRNMGKGEEENVTLRVKPEESPHGERRALPRKKTAPVVIDLLDPEGVQPRITAVVTDRSVGGLAIQSQDEVAVGSVWTAVPRSQRGTVKVSVQVEIRGCVRAEGAFVINCRFLRTVNYNELMNFE